MWRTCLLRASFSHSRSSLAARTTPYPRWSYREASASSLVPFRWFKKDDPTQSLTHRGTMSKKDIVEAQNRVKKFEKQKEKFIPVTRRTLVKKLVEEEGLLNWEEKRFLESFAASLDTYYSQKFYALLEEAKVRLGTWWALNGANCEAIIQLTVVCWWALIGMNGVGSKVN